MVFEIFDEINAFVFSPLVPADNLDGFTCLLLIHASELFEIFKSMNLFTEKIYPRES